jgi:hypothetical protein
MLVGFLCLAVCRCFGAGGIGGASGSAAAAAVGPPGSDEYLLGGQSRANHRGVIKLGHQI